MPQDEEIQVVVQLTHRTLHALRAVNGTIEAAGECVLENKASLEALLGAVAPAWKTQGIGAAANVWPDGTGWHLSTDTEAMLDRTAGSAARDRVRGPEGPAGGDGLCRVQRGRRRVRRSGRNGQVDRRQRVRRRAREGFGDALGAEGRVGRPPSAGGLRCWPPPSRPRCARFRQGIRRPLGPGDGPIQRPFGHRERDRGGRPVRGRA